MKHNNSILYALNCIIMSLIDVPKYFVALVLIHVIITNVEAHNASVKIKVVSNQYLVFDYVDFELLVTTKKTADENWNDLKKQPIKGIFDVLNTTFDRPNRETFQVNSGYVNQGDFLHYTWYFNRDSIIQHCKGILKLKVSFKNSNTVCYDSIQIAIPTRIVKISPVFGEPRNDYFYNIFKSGCIVHFNDGRSYITEPFFYDSQYAIKNHHILNNILVKGDIYMKNGKYQISYDNPQNIKQITFVNRKTNKIINTLTVPKSVYVQKVYVEIKPIQLNIQGIDGKDGNNYRMDSITKQSYYQIDMKGNRVDTQKFYKLNDIDISSINGGNGINGTKGINGKSVVVKIDRANKIDSIAKISLLYDDTVYVYFVDIINGGTVEIYNKGGDGTNGGNGGKCGYIENIDSVLYWGVAGNGGIGGDGGDGGLVTIFADRIYKNHMDKIRISNPGGMKGRGGVSALQITLDFAPKAGYYYNTERGLYLTGKLRLRATESYRTYAEPKFIVTKMPKTKGTVVDGKLGRPGNVFYNYY